MRRCSTTAASSVTARPRRTAARSSTSAAATCSEAELRAGLERALSTRLSDEALRRYLALYDRARSGLGDEDDCAVAKIDARNAGLTAPGG